MNYNEFCLKEIPIRTKLYRRTIEKFLWKFQLKLEENIEYYCGIFRDEELVAGGGFEGNIIKCVAVNPELQGEGLSNNLVSHLKKVILDNGYENILVFTKPNNKRIFQSMGFKTLAEAEKAIIMEDGIKGIQYFLENNNKEILNAGIGNVVGAIVMNCNPFTLGHQYLIEYAAKQCEILHVFIFEEDKSVFPFDVRYKLVQQEVQHLSNVYVHGGGQYIISHIIFPSYFIKKHSDILKAQTELDVLIFVKYIAPFFNIKKRFVGEEPNCEVTNGYNEIMKKILSSYGIDLIVIPKKKYNS